MENNVSLEDIMKLIAKKRVNFRWIKLPLNVYNGNTTSDGKLTKEELELLVKFYDEYKDK